MTQAMKEKDVLTLSTIRFLLAQIQNAEIEARGQGLKDEDVLKIIAKQVKQRMESIGAFKKGGRTDLAEKEEKEVKILQKYLPAQMSKEELKTKLQALVKELGLSAKKDFGKAMKEAVARFSGAAQPADIKAVLDNILQ